MARCISRRFLGLSAISLLLFALAGCSGAGPQAPSTDDVGSGGVPASDPALPPAEQGAAVGANPVFAQQNKHDVWKGSATPPASEASRAALLFDSVNELSWRYASQGDYDQNGEVNISDLTPLGASFGAVGPFGMDSALSLVDGDANDEINIADVTPIGINFGVVTSGYNVYASSDVGDYPVGSFT
ncbi:hypothetical protein IIA79_07360, partial [bacterium]|nr:hypothetical protein [bacterium]